MATSCGSAPRQTLFLGLSVQSVTMNMGWNEQQSNISVTLIHDTCVSTEGKVYYPRPGVVSTWTGADPGFQTPTIGAPVYFRLEDFEFAGIVQSWDLKESSSGQVYTVSIADPRLLLENLTVIISDYADTVGGIPNLINPYGYLESLGYPCAQQFINGASFGSPAGGFGGANNNDQGTPYNLLKHAMQALLCGVSHPKFSPYGFARYRGNSLPVGPSMGLLAADHFDSQVIADFNGNGYGAEYFVDISDIPFSPDYFRLAGPQDTLMNIISNVCSIAGCDFYIELLVTPALQKIIKVRTSRRREQPTLGVIEDYIQNNVTDGVISRDVGRELRNETTSSFLYGGYLQTVYEQETSSNIIQHWGYDSEGDLNNAVFNAGTGDWEVTLDLRPLNLNLKNALGANNVVITETEIRCALGEFDTWRYYSLTPTRTALGDLIVAVYPDLAIPIKNLPFPGINAVGNNMAEIAGVALNNNQNNNLQDDAAKDLDKIHKFITDFADELYGKKFLVKFPFVCFQTDADSGKTMYSDNPTSAGGYPARGVSEILSLDWQSSELDFFSSENNLVNAFVYFDTATIGAYPKSPDDTITHNDDVFVKATVEEKIIPYEGDPAALITISAVEDSKDKPNDMLEGMKILLNKVEAGGEDKVNAFALNNEAGKIGESTYAAAFRRRSPDKAAVPMISNTDRYGPYGYEGPAGQVGFQAADNIVPWNYGGYTVMDAAAAEQAQDSLTFMQVGEKGSFSFVGYPAHRLGQELKSTLEQFANVYGQTETVTIAGQTFTYQKFPMARWVGDLGPSITNISINVGSQGITTTYNLSTFSPSFGKMAKYNANRLAIIGKARQEQAREQRERDKIAKKAAEAEAKADKALANIAAQKQNRENIQGGANQIKTSSINTGSGVFSGKTNASTQQARPTQLINSPKQSGVAATSEDGFFVPVSKSGDSDLPKYAVPAGSCSDISPETSGQLRTRGTTPQMDPPVEEWTEPITNISYLDPFYSTVNPKHTTEDPTTLHHDTRIVAHGDPEDGPIIDLVQNEYTGNAFPEDFRMLAHKGPMLLHGWGYDTEGKPVPNFVDDPIDARSGIFKSTGLRDTFLTGWLTNQETWPVAPIDLRFDRTRAVWTVPNQFRIGIAKATGSGSGAVLIGGTSQSFNEEGSGIPSGSISFTVPEGMAGPKSGETFYAFYDNVDCTYYPLMSSGAASTSLCVVSSGCEASGSGDYGAGGTGYGFPSVCSVETIVLGKGLTLSQVCLSGANTGTGGCASGLTEGGFMNDPESGTPAAVIELDLNVSGYRDFCVDDQDLHGGSLESIKFGSGLMLSKESGDNSGCDGNFILDPVLQRLSNFECSGTTGDFQDQVYSGLLFSTGILVEDSGDCRYAISSNIRISDSSGACDTGRVPTIKDKVFTHLTFGSGLLVSGEECDYTIHGVLPKISNTGWCEYSGALDEEPFEHLRFGSGLTVSGSGCDYTVKAEHYIRDLDYCNWDASYTAYEFFTGLTIGTGLRVTGQGCEYGIDADHYVSSTGYCDKTEGGSGSIIGNGPEFFTELSFGSGFDVVSGDVDCKYQVHAEHFIGNSTACTGDGITGDFEFFNKLVFSSGMDVRNVSGCTYEIYNTHTISSENCGTGTGYETFDKRLFNDLKFSTGIGVTSGEGDCDWIVSSSITVSDVDYCDHSGSGIGGVFDELQFGSGLQLATGSGVSGCGYMVHADHKIKWTPSCGDTEEAGDFEFFNKLNFSSGLKVSGTGDCSFDISVERSIMEEGCGKAETEPAFYKDLVISSGLALEASGECGYKIINDFKVGNSGVCGQGATGAERVSNLFMGTGLRYEGAGDCTGTISSDIKVKDTSTCSVASTVEDYKLFSKLNFNSGLTLEETADCEYNINVNLLLDDEATCGDVVNMHDKPFQKITARSGLRFITTDLCEYKLDVNLVLEDEATCGQTSEVGETHYKKITARSGLKITEAANCEFKIDANRTLTAINGCNDSEYVSESLFNNLTFYTGLYVQDLGNCNYGIMSDRTLSDMDACTASQVLDPTFFKNLTFHSGLSVEDLGDCNYGISADITISSTGSTLIDSESVDNQFFKNLSFTSGLGVKHLGDCAYEVFASGSGGAISYISNSGCYADGPNFQPTQHLVFSTGLEVDQNLDDTNSWIVRGPKVSGSGTCGETWADWGGHSFDTLIFGTGFKSGDPNTFGGDTVCSPIVNIERLLSHDGACDATAIEDTYFKKLAFSTGIEVTDSGNCVYSITASHKLKDIDACGYTPDVPNYKKYTKLAFSSGLRVTGTECEFGILADRTITDSAYCSYSPSITPDTFFRNLNFKSGIQVTAGADCSFDINVSRSIKDIPYCDYTPSVAASKTYFETINFGSGLRITGAGCDLTVDANHRIKGDSLCNTYQVPDQFFSLLTFSTGMIVQSGSSDCEFKIGSTRRIGYTNCQNSQEITKASFNLLQFTTGIEVVRTGDADNCDFVIRSANRISDGSYCGYSNTSLQDKPYEKINARSGLRITSPDVHGCEYAIDVHRSITDDGYCNYAPSVVDEYYDSLVFGSGLKVTGNDSDCTYSIYADHTISSTGTTLYNSQSTWDNQFFRNLSFTSGLGVRALGDCSYEIWASGGGGGSVFITDTGCGATTPVAQSVAHFYFRSGLSVTEKTDEASAWFIDGPKVSVEHCVTPTYSRYKIPFDELVFSSGFSTGLNSTDCVPVIVGPRVSGMESCTSQPGAGNWGGNPFNMLVFGSGLYQEGGTDCQPIVHATQYISGSGDCDNQFPRSFFNELIFTTGTKIRSAADGDDCRYIISGPKVSGTGSCSSQEGAGNWGGLPFDTLIFGTGISKEGTDCQPIINAPQYVSGSGDCENDFPRSFFNELIFTTGINITGTHEEDNCSFILSGPRVSGIGSCSLDAGSSDWGGKPFQQLTFGTGFEKTNTDCHPVVHAPQYVSGSGCDGALDFNRKFFHDLIFTTGIHIEQTGGDPDADACGFFISGPKVSGEQWCTGQCEGGDCVPMYTGSAPFSNLIVSTGLQLNESGCGTMVLTSPNKVVNSFHCLGQDPYKDLPDSIGENYGELNFGCGITAKYNEQHCAHDIFLDIDMTGIQHYGESNCSPLDGWTDAPENVCDIFAGPGVYITGRSSGCEAVVYTNLQVSGVTGECPSNQSGTFSYIEGIQLGCGLRASSNSETVCDDKKSMEISIDPNAGRQGISSDECHNGLATGIRIVRDVCCSGDSFQVKYATINFSACGLFTHVSNDDGICTCDNC